MFHFAVEKFYREHFNQAKVVCNGLVICLKGFWLQFYTKAGLFLEIRTHECWSSQTKGL